MKPVIKLISADGEPFDAYLPADIMHFGVALEIGFGDEGEGYSLYRIRVCSPSWFSQVASENYFANGADFISGKGFLFLPRYDREVLKRILDTYMDWCAEDDWTAEPNRWSSLGNWESEDRMDVHLP